ncbi:LysR family transcriptional regulator [Pseudaminobacter arsenicus]|uniref:LysR family transcriptional regulator n=1 Tax=Borborobacter arsenicus TaxID=1851146 RepID=A0A432V1N4_9HYPH|nr:LysR substrate-binding domain-containing protein [Pseudaminobacter arsenicus]RUM96103.1 LysR family transcriptional regulator [Pseudaminobacter arsenicus]
MRLPDLTRLRYFVAVADTLNFRQASELLNIAQPAVSRAIQMLEAELGYKLLARTTRRVTLTEAGAVLARDARQAMQLLERSVRHSRQLASGKAGEIIAAYSAQAAHGPMADIVIRFRNALPSASVSLYQMASHEQLQAIESGQVDLGFMLSAACKPPLSHLRVVTERFVLLVSRYHPFSDRGSVALSEVKDAQFVMGTNKRWETFRTLVNSACLTAGFLPTIVEEADDVPVLLQLVSLQRGVTLYGSAITATLPPDVVAVPVSDPQAAFDIGIAWDARRQTPLASEFISFVEMQLAGDVQLSPPVTPSALKA